MIKTLKTIKKNLAANIVAVIDIGDIRTFCLIYRVFDNDDYQLLSIESVFTRGFEKGAVINLAEASSCLSDLLQLAEKTAKARIVDVIVSVPRDKTSIINYPVVKTFNREITRQDLDKLKDSNEYSLYGNLDNVIISVQHGDIFLDGKKVDNPEGMYASALHTDITIIKCFEPYIINLLNLFEYLSINLLAIIHPSVALPYLLDVNSPDLALFIAIDATTTNISISNKSKVIYHKEMNQGINNILNTALKNLGVVGNILEEKGIYDMSFATIKDKIVKFNFNNNEVKLSSNSINNELNEVITSFFKLIMLECKHINMNSIINISIIGECSNLIKLNTRFEEQMNSNLMLINKLRAEKTDLVKPLESVAALSIIKYYLKNYKTEKTLKILSKKLKDLLY
ncbi:MAG: hypothetical protein LBH40_00985 [Alphaproteobacteria bacterium]|jgi:Ethanolamine utilization protein EutJ (predicted chaperonin)|nr:hypothetical protein [Alphaproteobacteria bacterium]